MSESYFAEDGTDKWLAESGLLPESGIYVDVGCAHPWRYSQTAFLRNRGWTGLAIDGNPAYAPEWEGVANAKFVSAVLSDKPTVPFLVEPTNALVSRVHPEGFLTHTKTLNQVLADEGIDQVHLLALDIEGAEAGILHNDVLIWNATLPEIIVVEFNSFHKGRDVEVFNLFARDHERLGFTLRHMTESNAVFVR